MTDVETGDEKASLLGFESSRKMLTGLGSVRGENTRGGLGTLPDVPVGGHPGNDKFYTVVQLAVRLTVMCLVIGCMVWLPEQTKAVGMGNYAKHAGLAACLMIFFTTFTIGGVLMTASAGISGSFVAAVNIWLMRGFFPDGVTPGMGFFSSASIVGWVDLAIYNLMVLGFNCRMGFRMTALALNVSFMMCYLNPADQTVFSKNFQVNPNGAAVSAFLGVCIGSLCAVLAVLLPYPLGYATQNMKAAGVASSEDMCKLFIAAVKYFKGHAPSVLIERQMAQSVILQGQIGGLGANISDAYVETFDIATQGTIRGLFEKHSSVMGAQLDILTALQFAMSTEDFGESHVTCMDAIGDASHDLVDATTVLLIAATHASEDGDIDAAEKDDLVSKEQDVHKAVAALSEAFDTMRKKFGKSVCKELMNESFFVFCISAFARLTLEYTEILRTNPPTGKPLVGEIVQAVKDLFAPSAICWYHYRVVSRYWLSLMLCFLFSVHSDNFVPSCAITGVFLINTRVGPDVMAMIQGLLAVVVGIVTNALMYSFSCKFGNTQILMTVAVFYWLATITVGKGSSSLAGIGLLMSALSPFALFKFCIPDTPAAAAANAIGLWSGIRALLIAVVITIIAEFVHIPGLFSQLSRDSLDEAFTAMEDAFKNMWGGEKPEEAKDAVTAALAKVSAKCGDAETYNTACLMEPRLWMCPWKSQFLTETTAGLKKIRLDVMLIKQALCGLDGDMAKITNLLNKVPEVALMQKDLDSTLADAHELAVGLLKHETGKFEGLKCLDTVFGIDELDGYEAAIEGQAKIVDFPEKAPEDMEDDVLVRLSIVYCMMQYLISHVAGILKGGVKLS
jgi:hypothetical protein